MDAGEATLRLEVRGVKPYSWMGHHEAMRDEVVCFLSLWDESWPAKNGERVSGGDSTETQLYNWLDNRRASFRTGTMNIRLLSMLTDTWGDAWLQLDSRGQKAKVFGLVSFRKTNEGSWSKSRGRRGGGGEFSEPELAQWLSSLRSQYKQNAAAAAAATTAAVEKNYSKDTFAALTAEFGDAWVYPMPKLHALVTFREANGGSWPKREGSRAGGGEFSEEQLFNWLKNCRKAFRSGKYNEDTIEALTDAFGDEWKTS